MRRIDCLSRFFIISMVLTAYASQAAAQDEKTTDVSTRIFFGTKNKIKEDRITAYMNVEGREFPMVLDTGAGVQLTLFKPATNALGLELTKVEQAPRFHTAQVRIGIGETGETLSKPLSIMVLDTPIVKEHYGIIGWQLIKNSIIEINALKASWKYHTAMPKDLVEQWESFPIIEHDGANLMFLIEENNKKHHVCLDTGSGGGVSLSKEAWEKWREKNKPEWITLDAGFSPATRNGFSVTKKAIDDDFHLGEFHLGMVSVEETFAEVRMDGTPIDKERLMLGMEAIRARRVLIDGRGKRIYFGPIGQPTKKEIRINRAQATFIPQAPDYKVQVAHVIKDGTAYNAGLRDGDLVLMVNGVMAANWRDDESVRPGNRFNDEPGTRVRLLVERDGERFPVTIELQPSPYDPVQEEGQ